MPEEDILLWKIQMTAEEFIVTVCAQDEERVVNALVDSGVDPCVIVVKGGSEPGAADIGIIKEA